ncbi:hypothetical protein SGLAM104S_04992 [Streptomyces glaucescens]
MCAGTRNISRRCGFGTIRPSKSAVTRRSRSAVVEIMSPAAQRSAWFHSVTSTSRVVPSGRGIAW